MGKVEDASIAKPACAGWLVQVRKRYYTASGRSQLERWTPFPQFAKVYRRQAWAHKIAGQLGGEVVAVAEQRRVSN